MIGRRRALAALGLGVGVALSTPWAAAAALDLVDIVGPPPAATPVYDHDAPDPDVIRVTSAANVTTYYAYTTNTGGENIPVLSSSDLRTWTPRGDALPHLPAWQSPGFVWAPGVAQFGATYVMYYASLVTSTSMLCISEATASSPTGPFTDTRAGPLVCQTDVGGSIDPSPFIDVDGRAYLYWKSNAGGAPVAAQIWEAPLSADGTALVGAPTAVLNQDQSWEATVEGPDMVHANGQYLLFYSGGLWNGAGYGVGYALCAGPAGPCAKPVDGPVLHSDQLRLGPGGESFFTDSNGDLFMAYATWEGPSSTFSYASGAYRSLWIASVTFDPAPVIHADEPPEGYVLAAADGGAFTFGAMGYHGSMGGQPLAAPVVSSAATADGGGYWMVAADGGVFSFGDAAYSGSMGGKPLSAPVVGMAPTADGGGYWLVASDGGVFAFGDAPYSGSMGGKPLSAPVVGMAAMPQGGGYWLVGADGGVFNFGRAQFFGSMGGQPLARPVVGVAAGPGGGGYWLVGADGGVFTFGDGDLLGSEGGAPLAAPVVALASG